MTEASTRSDPATFAHPDVSRSRLVLSAANRRLSLAEGHLAALLLAQRLHEAEAARHAEENARDPKPVVTVEEASRLVNAGGVRVQYHQGVEAERFDAAERDVRRTRREQAKAQQALAELLADPQPYDVAAACEAAGTSWFALRSFTLGGRQFVRGEPVPADVLRELNWQKRAALRRARYIEEVIG